MAEYIEREKVLEMLLSADDGNIGSENWRAAIDAATTGLYNMPAADVQEVKHGKWTHDEFDMLCCSECKEELEFEETTPYCPYCGAKMDGKDV